MAKRPTQGEVARLAGTSTAVVSYVINNGPRPVSEETRQRVLDAIEKVGYRPNNLARALAFGQSTVFALLVPDLANPFLAQMAQALEREFFSRGFSLLIGDSEDSLDREVSMVETMMSQQVAGVVWYGVEQPLPLDIVEDSDLPVVLLNSPPGEEIPERRRGRTIRVRTDERGHARIATEHLLNHGRTHIAHLGGPTGRLNARERARGWSDALKAAGQAPGTHITAPFSREGGLDAASTVADLGCDAVVASNEMQAVGLLAGLAQLGVTVPDDVAVVALNGTSGAAYTIPPLTALHLDLAGLSAGVADALRPDSEVTEVDTSAELVRRDSCGCRTSQKDSLV